MISSCNFTQEIINEKPKSDSMYDFYCRKLEEFEIKIKEAENEIILFSEIEPLVANYRDGNVVCLKFEATRQVNITKTDSVVNVESMKENLNNKSYSSAATYFENYLVSYKTR